MKKGALFLVLLAVTMPAWCGGSGEPKPAPAPVPTPRVISTTQRVYTRSSVASFSDALMIVIVPVSIWSDGHREFAGSPTIHLYVTPHPPYLLEVPTYASTNVKASKLLIVANYVRAFQRLPVGASPQSDPYYSWPIMQVQPYTFVILP